MSLFTSIGALLGVAIVVLAGIGLLKFDTPYARIHAAGKASPVAFLIVAVAASVEVGWAGTARLVLASVALILTLPVAVHLLFRAVHTAEPEHNPATDEIPAG